MIIEIFAVVVLGVMMGVVVSIILFDGCCLCRNYNLEE